MSDNPYQSPVLVDEANVSVLLDSHRETYGTPQAEQLLTGVRIIHWGLANLLVAFGLEAFWHSHHFFGYGFLAFGLICLLAGNHCLRRLGTPISVGATASILLQLVAAVGFVGLLVRVSRGHVFNGLMQLFAASTIASLLISIALVMIVTRLCANKLGEFISVRASEVAIVAYAVGASSFSLASMRVFLLPAQTKATFLLAFAAVGIAITASLLATNRLKRSLRNHLRHQDTGKTG